jgi:hypothetical protein
MSDSPNRALDFGAGVLVGILLAVGVGGFYTFAKMREQNRLAAEARDQAMYAERVARAEAEMAAHEALDAERRSHEAERRGLTPAKIDHAPEVPEMPPAKDPE